MQTLRVSLLARLLLGLLAALLVLPAAAAPALATPAESAARAVAWIRTQQQPDGSFAGFGAGSTADALLALAAAGENPAAISKDGQTPVSHLTSQAAAIAADPGLAAKVVIALLVSGQSPRSLGGVDLVQAVSAGYDAASGHYGADVTAHALALLALRAAGEPVPEAALAWLTSAQLDDGSWSFTGDRTAGAGDTNTTALAVQALVAHGQRQSPAVQGAVAYLRTQQNPDAGFPYSQTSQFGNASDVNSTAYAIQALIAAGEDLASWKKDAAGPVDRLLAFQNESGAFRYQEAMPEDNQLATYQAVPALLGRTFPLEPLAIIQQPEQPTAQATAQPAQPTALPAQPEQPTSLPLPVAGEAERPAALPETGSATQLFMPLALLALLALFLGLAVRARRA